MDAAAAIDGRIMREQWDGATSLICPNLRWLQNLGDLVIPSVRPS